MLGSVSWPGLVTGAYESVGTPPSSTPLDKETASVYFILSWLLVAVNASIVGDRRFCSAAQHVFSFLCEREL